MIPSHKPGCSLDMYAIQGASITVPLRVSPSLTNGQLELHMMLATLPTFCLATCTLQTSGPLINGRLQASAWEGIPPGLH